MIRRAIATLALATTLATHAAETAPTRLAFGSCNREDLPQPLWEPIVAFDPEIWIWLGDAIYGDTLDMAELERKWTLQKNQPAYARLASSATILGTWDDHDYGANNAGFTYRRKKESQQLILDFLDEPPESPRRRRDGIHDARTFGPPGRRLMVVLLDVRYFRAAPRTGGDILGEAQWIWLEKTLRASDADIHLFCSGTQILPQDHRFEKWADYPTSRQRLIDLVRELDTPGVILLSGDRHIAEISRLPSEDGHPAIVELTTSGLTHSWEDFPGEKNSLRVGAPFTQLNFGTLGIDWRTRSVNLAIRDRSGDVVRSLTTSF